MGRKRVGRYAILAGSTWRDPELLQLSRTNRCVFYESLAWCADQQSGGVLPSQIVTHLGIKKAHVLALISARLWLPNGQGWRIRNWEKYNVSAGIAERDVVQKRDENGSLARAVPKTQDPRPPIIPQAEAAPTPYQAAAILVEIFEAEWVRAYGVGLGINPRHRFTVEAAASAWRWCETMAQAKSCAPKFAAGKSIRDAIEADAFGKVADPFRTWANSPGKWIT
jgi:hypothetical protein